MNFEYRESVDVKPSAKKEDIKAITILPEIVAPARIRFGVGVKVRRTLIIPPKALVCRTIIRALYSRRGNPDRAIEPDETRGQGLNCIKEEEAYV